MYERFDFAATHPRRSGDILLSKYLRTKPGSTEALRLLAEARQALKENRWEYDDRLPPSALPIGSKIDHYRALRDLREDEKDSICELYAGRVTLSNISQRFGISRCTVERVLITRGVQRDRRDYVDPQKVARMMRDGVCPKVIAERLKCSVSTVYVKLKQVATA